jgi:hypothetical protein
MTGAEFCIFVSFLISMPAVSAAIYESIVGTDCLDDNTDDLTYRQRQSTSANSTVSIYKSSTKERHPWISEYSDKRSFSLDDIGKIEDIID